MMEINHLSVDMSLNLLVITTKNKQMLIFAEKKMKLEFSYYFRAKSFVSQ